ncbi:hypothetical protein [Methyloglobulus sp.]|uniref:hypothetical protein n=1 Tax=Methyloglobulus sp. TaxID=2518622 RepID=UPI0032B70207
MNPNSGMAYAILLIWFVVFAIGMLATFTKYFKKSFKDDVIYNNHRQVWLFAVAVLCFLQVLIIFILGKDYDCEHLLCQWLSIPLTTTLILTTALGPANAQNHSNKGMESVVMFLFIVPMTILYFSLDLHYKNDETLIIANVIMFIAIFITFVCQKIPQFFRIKERATKIAKPSVLFFSLILSCAFISLILIVAYKILIEF